MCKFSWPLLAAVLLFRAALAQGSPAASEPPSLTLPQALALALQHNPGLAAARADVDASSGARLQAQARPNPALSVLLEDTRRDTRTTTVQINQPIELGGQRAARVDAADRGVALAQADLDMRRLAVHAEVVTAFFDLLAIQERTRVAEASLALAQRSTRAATGRVQAGKVSPVEQTKARVAEAGIRLELAQVRGEEVSARARLDQSLGRPVGAPLSGYALTGRLADLPAVPAESRVRDLLADAPALRRARLEVQRREAMTALEQARRMGDLTVSLGARRDVSAGRSQAVVGLSIPLPLFDRNQGNVQEAMGREDGARQALEVARAQAESQALQAREGLALAGAEARALTDDILPGAQSAFDAATRGFELGKFSFLEALDAQRTLLGARTQYLRALAQAHRAAAELNRILGIETLPGTP